MPPFWSTSVPLARTPGQEGALSVKRIDVERDGPMLKHTCTICGATAWVHVGNRTQTVAFCSAECRKIALSARFNHRAERICGECGTIFHVPQAWVRKGNGKFCSHACYAAHQHKHPHGSPSANPTPLLDLTCRLCRKAFRARRSREYCSNKCRMNATRPSSICPACSKPFTVFPSYTGQVYCSMACKLAQITYRGCQRCGKLFNVKPSEPNRRHCSEQCRRPPVILTCPTCAIEFRVQPSMVGSGNRFCSARCYRRFTGETGPERNARLILELEGIEFIQEYVVPGWRYPVDFLLPELNTALEIDEPYWHERTKARDERKTRFLESRGLCVVRLGAKPLYGDVTPAMAGYLLAGIKDSAEQFVVRGLDQPRESQLMIARTLPLPMFDSEASPRNRSA